jgi:hypothetical protein
VKTVVFGFFAGILLECDSVFHGQRQTVKTRERRQDYAQGLGGFLELPYLAGI